MSHCPKKMYLPKGMAYRRGYRSGKSTRTRKTIFCRVSRDEVVSKTKSKPCRFQKKCHYKGAKRVHKLRD